MLQFFYKIRRSIVEKSIAVVEPRSDMGVYKYGSCVGVEIFSNFRYGVNMKE